MKLCDSTLYSDPALLVLTLTVYCIYCVQSRYHSKSNYSDTCTITETVKT